MGSSVVAMANMDQTLRDTTRVEASVATKLPLSRMSAELIELEKNDSLFSENPQRWVMFPIKYPEVWEMYKKHEASFWTAEEIDLSQDNTDWDRLTDAERHFIKHILPLFAASDGTVLENLAAQLSTEIQIPEARALWLPDSHGKHSLRDIFIVD